MKKVFLRSFFAFSLLLVLSLASCEQQPSPTPIPSASPAPILPSTSPTPSPSPTIPPTDAPSLPPRPRYTFDIALDYAAKTLDSEEAILYPNDTGEELSDILLAVEPNLWGGCFHLNGIRVNGAELPTYALDGHALTLYLPSPLEPNDLLNIEIQFHLDLPEIDPVDTNLVRPRIFGYTARQINLTNWYPFIVPRIGGEWILHDPWFYGEHLVYPSADFDLVLHFADAENPPVVAASGALDTEPGKYILREGRVFVLSISPEFHVFSETNDAGVTVFSYYLIPYEKPARAVLETTLQSLQIYSEKYGAYPHRSISAVQGDFNDGMEYSAFYFLPRDFYNLYDGTDKNYLTFVAAHETSHQWWFEQVANDQALHPWLDESLATYSEHLYYENTDPALLDWWWQYRMYYYDPSAYMDIPVYEGQGFQPYTNAVYFRGAHFLDELRAQIGDDAFFAFLQDYLSQERGKIAEPQDFFRILREHTNADFSALLTQFFRTPPMP